MMIQSLFAVVLLGGVAALGCAAKAVESTANDPSKGQLSMTSPSLPSAMPALEVEELRQELQSTKPPVLVDVREPSEHESAKIPGDMNIPLGDLPKRYTEIPKDQPVVVYCRSGNRSARAVMLLQEKGYTSVKNLTGGITAWVKRVDPGMKMY